MGEVGTVPVGVVCDEFGQHVLGVADHELESPAEPVLEQLMLVIAPLQLTYVER